MGSKPPHIRPILQIVKAILNNLLPAVDIKQLNRIRLYIGKDTYVAYPYSIFIITLHRNLYVSISAKYRLSASCQSGKRAKPASSKHFLLSREFSGRCAGEPYSAVITG